MHSTSWWASAAAAAAASTKTGFSGVVVVVVLLCRILTKIPQHLSHCNLWNRRHTASYKRKKLCSIFPFLSFPFLCTTGTQLYHQITGKQSLWSIKLQKKLTTCLQTHTRINFSQNPTHEWIPSCKLCVVVAQEKHTHTHTQQNLELLN
jgi:hypothetical protein